jgi:hypothetical protein
VKSSPKLASKESEKFWLTYLENVEE